MILEQLYKGATKEAWFYLRDAYYVEEVPKSDRHLFQSEVALSLCSFFLINLLTGSWFV